MSMHSYLRRAELLTELQRVEKMIRADLLSQYRSNPELMARARVRLDDEENSPSDVEAWLQSFAGRAAVLYILKSLYIRVLEDQGLMQPIRIRSGGTYELFARLFPNLGIAAYLRRVFDDASRLLPELFSQTPIEIAEPSESCARALWAVWQSPAEGGGLRFDFRGKLDTRFIGDLYQDLDPDVQKRYALLQTPEFIEQFILDQTLEPAIDSFGLDDFRIIDPTCGSGHFLLGAFERLFKRWRERLGDSPESKWQAAARSLASVYGADLNEYACALSRFRLLLALVRETGVTDTGTLQDAHINIITCDSLIPWENVPEQPLPGMDHLSWLTNYGNDAERQRNEKFFAAGFHAVVGNPPYIAVSDEKKREDYRRAWPRSAMGKYSLSAPMTERFLTLPVSGGYAGIIVANNFTKRSFGRGLVERVLSNVQLNLVVDTSGAYIPGHGTPTVMLFAANRKVRLSEQIVTVVVGKQGEPREPKDPARGVVWSTITAHWNERYEDRWIAVQRMRQDEICRHPWSLGNDAALKIKAALDKFPRIADLGGEAGIAVVAAEDEIFMRRRTKALPLRPVVTGEGVRDWKITTRELNVAFPYKEDGLELASKNDAEIDLWHQRTTLSARGWRGSSFGALGMPWWSFAHVARQRLGASKTRIVIAEIATNGHFVVDTSDAIFTQTAPVITFRDSKTTTYLDVSAVLNSSVLEFWMKQVCFDKGNGGINEGIRGDDWEKFFVRNSTNVVKAPVPNRGKETRLQIVRLIDEQLRKQAKVDPNWIIEDSDATLVKRKLEEARVLSETSLNLLVALQEELDWSVYASFGLIENLPLLNLEEIQPLTRGHRPFEIALARRKASGDVDTTWFERHLIIPVTEIPAHYNEAMRRIMASRLNLIETNETVNLLEQPIYKRRWQMEPWDLRLRSAAERWILERLEKQLQGAPRLLSLDEIVARLSSDQKFAAVVSIVKRDNEVTDADSIKRLLEQESIPDNPARLFTPRGLSKYTGLQTAFIGEARSAPDAQPLANGEPVDWKRSWRLQERVDAGHAVEIAVPPAFVRADYAHPNGWRLRGKFNIPNERFIVFGEIRPVRYAWAGLDVTRRAELSLQAFELRGSQPDSSPIKPTVEEPERCGIQFALWDKIDELRRIGDVKDHAEVSEIAQLCGKSCPCGVLDSWRNNVSSRGNGNGRKREIKALGGPQGQSEGHLLNAELLGRTLAEINSAGVAGISLRDLERLFAGDKKLARAAVEALRASGDVEALGKGRAMRYRRPQQRLL